MATTPGKDAVIRWVEETTIGTTPTNPAFKLFSKETLRANLKVDVGQQESLDMGNVDIEEYFNVQNTYDIQVECHLYDVDRILDFLARNADNSLKGYTLEYIPDASAATKHYYRCLGWRLRRLELSVNQNEPWKASLTFAAGKIVAPVTSDPGIGTGSREAKAAITQSIATFASGAVTLNAATWAILVNSFNVSFENDIEAVYTMGQADPVVSASLSGTRRISGSADISLDEGGKEHWDRVVAGATHTIAIPFGTAGGSEILSLTGAEFTSAEVESNTDDTHLMGDQPFTAAGFSRSTV